MRILVWLNIIVQTALPLGGAFTPSIVRAQTPPCLSRFACDSDRAVSRADRDFLRTDAERHMQADRDPPDDRRKLADSGDTGLAARAQTLGSMLKNGHTGDAAAGMARSMASGAANDAVAGWLSRVGTARVGLSLDEKGSLANSSIDWLVPLYDTPRDTLFTQLGARNRDGRNTLNLGWGVRRMVGRWMFGFNNFWDNDITGHNRRTGLGAEARTDYLQFAGNTYLRLNNWHQSRDFTDYDERPANGFDVRAQGWLPAYPQVGGKVIYERYYGNEVALFGKDTRQRNPYAVTAGLDWTPFPLLTVGVDERVGKGGQNETNVNLQLSWRPGESLSSQLSSGSVGDSRRVAASRYDLVDRNNNIVLEYRKQELVRLSLSTASITGPAGSAQPVSAVVNNKYGLRGIVWEDSNLTAAGGSLKALDSTHFSVTLPPYRTSQRAQAANRNDTAAGVNIPNIYVLTAVAEDMKGNVSSPQNVTVTVLPPVVSFDGQLQVTNDNMPADGSSAETVTAVITDSNHHALADQQVTFTMTYADGSHASETAVTDGQGKAAVKVTSTVAGEASVKAMAGNAAATATLHFVSGSIDVPHSSLSISPPVIPADGVSAATLTLKAQDTAGHPVTGLATKLAFVATGVPGVTVSAVTESPATSGHYTVQISGTRPGTASLAATLGGRAISGLTAHVTLSAQVPDATKSALTRAPDTIPADGTTASTLTLTLHDTLDHPVKGQAVQFMSDLAGSAAGPTTDNGDGTYTATLTGTAAGTAHISATVGGVKMAGLGVAVTVTAAPPLPAKSALDRSPDTIPADGTTASTLKLTLKDVLDRPMKGQTVVFVADKGAVSATTDNGDGTYTAKLTAAPGVTGTANITVKVGGNTFGTLKTTVALTALPPLPGKSVLDRSPDTIPADGTTASTLKLTLKDSLDHPVKGQTVVFVADKGTAGATTDNGDGTYTAKLTAAAGVTGTANVSVKVGGSVFGTLKTTVALTALPPLPAKSTLTHSKDSILADGTDKSTLTLTLNDVLDQKVKGQTVVFVADKGTVSATTDNGDGTYTAKLTSTAAGTANVSVKVGGNAFGSLKTTVTLAAIAAFKDILVSDGHTFNMGDGFPSTAAINTFFDIRIKDAASGDYDWYADKSWVSVVGGKVAFTSAPTSKEKVTITATPKPGYIQKSTLHYSFTITDWFISHTSYGELEWLAAKTRCTGSEDIPTRDNLTKGINVRGVGSYWSEWGGLPDRSDYWTSTQPGPGERFMVKSDNGFAQETGDGTAPSNATGSTFVAVICHRAL